MNSGEWKEKNHFIFYICALKITILIVGRLSGFRPLLTSSEN